MCYPTKYQRYLVELAVFCLLVFFGIAVNSQAMIALGLLVLVHCLPTLVLTSIRLFAKTGKQDISTCYINGSCSFREKEIVELISCALIIGVAVGLLVLSIQKISFLPLGSVSGITILGLSYIAIELSMYVVFNVISKTQSTKKPPRAKVIRILVALLVIATAHIQHELLQELADTITGLGVLIYITFISVVNLIGVAHKIIDYTPRGIAIDDVKAFLLGLPGVVSIDKIYFRRVNELEHEIGLHIKLERYLLENSAILKEKIKREVEAQFGVSGVTVEFLWQEAPIAPLVEPDIIVLGHQQ